MDKISILDKNNKNIKIASLKNNFESNNFNNSILDINNKDTENSKQNSKQNNDSNIDSYNDKIKKNKDKNIKIIMVNNNNKIKSNNNLLDDNISEFNNDELDNELKKILG